MITYKLFRLKNKKLYPLYVESNNEMPIGIWLNSKCGEKIDTTHVKSRLGALALRSGFHSTEVPFTDWIGKRKPDGSLIQKSNTVWCECEVQGNEIECKVKKGYSIVPKNSFYYFKTNSKQKRPWIISDLIKINRILNHDEVVFICNQYGIQAQEVEAS